jgi:hypothetical protein
VRRDLQSDPCRVQGVPNTPHPFTPFPSSLSPGEREEGKGSWGEGSCRNADGLDNADGIVKPLLRPRQTRKASPAESGFWLWHFSVRTLIAEELSNTKNHRVAKASTLRYLLGS